jgi:hypothetical protein
VFRNISGMFYGTEGVVVSPTHLSIKRANRDAKIYLDTNDSAQALEITESNSNFVLVIKHLAATPQTTQEVVL